MIRDKIIGNPIGANSMTSSHSHKRKNSHLFLQRKNSSSAEMASYEMNPMDYPQNGDDPLPNPVDRPSYSHDSFTKLHDDIENQSVPNRSVIFLQFRRRAGVYKTLGIVITVTLLVLLTLVILPTKGFTKDGRGNETLRNRKVTIDAVLEGDFLYDERAFRFVRPSSPFLLQDSDTGLYLTTFEEGTERRLLAGQLYNDSFFKDLGKSSVTYNNVEYVIKKVRVSYDLNKMIMAVNLEQEYRYSSKGFYFLKDVNTGIISPISPFISNDLVSISYACFSPNYRFIYFVYKNNIYIQEVNSDSPSRQITMDGSEDVFNGKPDWVYEEEILSSDRTVWWAPDDSKMLFARIDDQQVENHYIPRYTTKQTYPPISRVKYPKPGTANPQINLFVFDLKTGEKKLVDLSKADGHDMPNFPLEIILYDAQWIDPKTCLLKITDRTSKILLVLLFNADTDSLDVVRTMDASSYGGWIEKTKKLLVIPPKVELGRTSYGYVDIQVDQRGFNHLFYYDKASSKAGQQLTSGDWEVSGAGIVGYEYESDTIFFTANEAGPMSQHLYSVTLASDPDNFQLRSLQNSRGKHDFYDFELSLSCKYALMKSLGPNIPFTAAGPLESFVDVAEIDEDNILVLSDNATLVEAVTSFDLPGKKYRSMALNDGIRINYVEILPPHMDSTKKYPILVSVYGGPGSQTYSTKYSIFFEEAVASGLDAIVLEIEPRGTGYYGWTSKKWAKEKIGYWEPRDVVEVTKRYISQSKNMINEERIAIWGWSYGAFVSLKTIEYDAGQVFNYAIAVAPVTNWTYYDSFYTERVMGDPTANHNQYRNSAIQNIQNFGQVSRFLIMHGTADDNVHIENTYEFLDRLDLLDIENYDMHIFPDSDHSIQYHNAQHIIFRKLYSWLNDAFTGRFDTMSVL